MDEVYIKRVLDGDLQAYTHIVRQHESLAMRTAMSIVKNEKDAEDIVQNSFTQAYISLSQFRNQAKFSTWLCRIVINNSLNFKQRKKSHVTDLLHIMDNEPSVENEGILHLEREELNKILVKALKLIPDKEALVLQLFYIEEYSTEEIASITNFTKSNIKVLLHRGRKNLQYHLNRTNLEI